MDDRGLPESFDEMCSRLEGIAENLEDMKEALPQRRKFTQAELANLTADVAYVTSDRRDTLEFTFEPMSEEETRRLLKVFREMSHSFGTICHELIAQLREHASVDP
jgi:nitrogen fixation/metabolism regulation signal transduction histidine kinase